MFHKEKYLSQEKVIPMDKFANHYNLRETAYKGGYIIGFFNPAERHSNKFVPYIHHNVLINILKLPIIIIAIIAIV